MRNQFFILCVFLIGMISSAWADEIEEYKERLSNYKEQSSLLQQQKMARLFSKEFTQLNQNIIKADQLLKNDEEDDFKRQVDLVSLQLVFIEVSIHELEDKEKIQKIKDQAVALENKVKTIRQEINKLETQLNQQSKPNNQSRQQPIQQPMQ